MKTSLKEQLRVVTALDINTLSKAYKAIDKTSSEYYMASAVTITIKNINIENNLIVEEFGIINGLSIETIEAIKKDIVRTYEDRLLLSEI